MPSKKLIVCAVIAASAAFSAQADSGFKDSSSTTIRIQAFVPVLCHVRLDTSVGVPDDNGVASLGTAKEFCNASRGYRVIVQHPTNLQGAALISDGQRIPLSATGETIITDASHAAIRSVSLAADLGDVPERFRSISIRIEAKG